MNLIDAFTAAKAAYDLTTVAIQARDDVKIQSAMADLREKIWDMSGTGLTQMQALHSLELETQKLRVQLADAERAKAQLEAQLKEEAQYQITEVCPGGWAYMLVSDTDKPVQDRPHFCPVCNANSKKMPMRHYQAQGQLAESWTCMADSGHRLAKPDPNRSSYALGHDPRHWSA